MKIIKFGHCCLLIEIEGKRILTDPGKWSKGFEEVLDIDIILISHEHADHLHTGSLKEVLNNNQNARVICNTSVGKILEEQGISYEILEGQNGKEFDELTIQAFDGEHAEIFEEVGIVQNTGYFIANKLFYPGDAYTEPNRDVDILALPVAGPWCKSADAINYALNINPKKAFPVHDAVLNEEGIELVHGLFSAQLSKKDIDFVSLKEGEVKEF